MAKTKLKIADRKDIFLYVTRVENLFINEFLPGAPGEYVKLYLFALMYAQYEEEIDSEGLARCLGMEVFEVEEAWDYWEARGLISKSRDGSTIEFLRMVERFYGKDKDRMPGSSTPDIPQKTETGREDVSFDDEEVDSYFDFDSEPTDRRENKESTKEEQLRKIFSRLQELAGRTISRKETERLSDAISIYGVSPEVLYYAIDYCADLGNYSADYISTVALRWKEEGCEDTQAVKELLERHSARSSAYHEVFKAVGFNRLTTPADREIMDRWFDEMGFDLDEVLEACKATGGIREPSLRYVNKILENKMLEKGGVKVTAPGGKASAGAGDTSGGAKVSRKVLKDYYDHIREEEDAALAGRLREAAAKAPAIAEVLEKEKKLSMDFAGLVQDTGAAVRRKQIKEERDKLEESKRRLLKEAGYPEDYLERRYRCNICKDSGYTDEGTVCSCCRARADEAYMWITKRDKN